MADDKELEEDNLPNGDMSGSDGEEGEKKRGIKDDIKDEVEDRVKEKAKDEAKKRIKKAAEKKAKEKAEKAAKKAAEKAAKKAAEKVAKKAAEEGIKQAAIHGGGAAVAGGTATAAGLSAAAIPYVGWVIAAITLIVSIIAAILKWIKDHPYEFIAAVVLILVIAMLPVIIPVVAIIALLQALWAFISNMLGLIDDTAMKVIDNISFGLVSYEKMDTLRDVNEYMKLIDNAYDEQKDERQSKEISDKKNEKAKLEKLKSYRDKKTELETKKSESSDSAERNELTKQIAEYKKEIEALETELGDVSNLDGKIANLTTEIENLEKKYADEGVDDESKTRDMMLDMYDMTKNYFDELYVRRHVEEITGERIMLPTDLQKEEAKTWVNLSQKDKSKYLATNVYGISEEILDNLYMGKMFTNEERTIVASKLEKGKKYYYGTAEEFKYNSDTTIYKSRLVTYYDILGSRSIDVVAYEGLKNYYSWNAEVTFDKIQGANVDWNDPDFTALEHDNEIKRLLRTRLTAYVSAEKQFWASNGDKDVETSDVLGVVFSSSVGNAIYPGVGTIASLQGLYDITEKLLLDNNKIKENGYRVIEENTYQATLAFNSKDGGVTWRLYPLACKNTMFKPTIEVEGLIDWIVELFGGDLDSVASEDKLEELIVGKLNGINQFLYDTNAELTTKELFDERLFSITVSWEDGIELNAGEDETKYVMFTENYDASGNKYYSSADGTTYRNSEESHFESGENELYKYNSETITRSEYIVENGTLYKKVTEIFKTENEYNSLEVRNGNVIINGNFNAPLPVAQLENDFDEINIIGNTMQCVSSRIISNDKVTYTSNGVEYQIVVANAEGAEMSGNTFDINNFIVGKFANESQETDGERYLDGKRGVYVGYTAQVAFKKNTLRNDIQKAIYFAYKDGEDNSSVGDRIVNFMRGDGAKTNQEKIDELAEENGVDTVDLTDVKAINEVMNGTGFSLLDERELIKPYGIPSAFSYFIPLEESTRNIPFLIALAQEMKNTKIGLSPLTGDDAMYEEILTYDIEDKGNFGSLSKDEWFGIWTDRESGRLLIKAFGIKLVDIYPGELKTYEIKSITKPVREVIYANLWDREIFNVYKEIIRTNYNGNLYNLEGEYSKNVDYILANQYVSYNDKPYELITKYNVSQADVGIYEEVTGRPFLNQYTYEQIQNITDQKEAWAKDEWKDSLMANEMYHPVDSSNREEVRNGNVVTGYKYSGSGDVYSVEDGELIEIEEVKAPGALYSSYIILYHEEDKTFSMYSNINFGVQKEGEKVVGIKVGEGENERIIKIGDKVNQGDTIGTYSGTMYFEYRQGGGNFKEFWSATPIKVGSDKLLDEIEVKEKISTPDDDAEAADESTGGGSGGAAGGPAMGGNHSDKVNAQQI